MRKLFVILAIFVATATNSVAQNVAIKTNLLADATASMNLALEVGFAKRMSFDLNASYNPFTFSGDRRFQHILVQPELRIYTVESLNGLFFGVHGVWAPKYRVNGFAYPFYPEMKDADYEGGKHGIYGVGMTIGYQWPIHKRWNIEFALGGGYLWIDYKEFDCGDPCNLIKSGKIEGFFPTRATVGLVFFFN